jgi:phosphoesterase RecJ-like protein
MLATLALHDGGRIASCVLTRAMFERAGAGPGDSEGLIDHPRGIAGVEAVFLLRELGENRWKASLRSRGEVDVETIARRHGGGGHKNASGFTVEGRLSDLSATLVEELVTTLDQPVG